MSAAGFPPSAALAGRTKLPSIRTVYSWEARPSASLLNLNNEVFDFYNGAERYPIQREYYNRTISAGLRWTLFGKEPQ